MENKSLDQLKKMYQENQKAILEDFFTFLRFPSISSEGEYKGGIHACVNWLSNYLKDLGFHVELWPTRGHPVLFASYLEAGPQKPTLLIYNHYDVQPVDPLELWDSPPFEPTIRAGQVYARGAQDNKGQCFYTLQALAALLKRDGSLPVNIKLCIEGEEECGSAGLSEILKRHNKQLKADYVAIVDVGIPNLNTPTLTLGLRGLVTMDVTVEGSRTDLHSGCHGGIAYNPLHALVTLLAKLRDPSGKITIPGFYDKVQGLSEEERSQLHLHFDPSSYEKTFGAKPLGGEQAFAELERNWVRPTLEINGIAGGYGGPGFKTVIPAKALAKISCRLVPDQDPDTIGSLVARFLEKEAPQGVSVKVNIHKGKGKPVRAQLEQKGIKAFAKAFGEVFEKPCKYIYEGASIPIVPELAEASGGEVVMLGLGLADDQIHAPNEHFGLDRLEKGYLIMARAIEILAENCR